MHGNGLIETHQMGPPLPISKIDTQEDLEAMNGSRDDFQLDWGTSLIDWSVVKKRIHATWGVGNELLVFVRGSEDPFIRDRSKKAITDQRIERIRWNNCETKRYAFVHHTHAVFMSLHRLRKEQETKLSTDYSDSPIRSFSSPWKKCRTQAVRINSVDLLRISRLYRQSLTDYILSLNHPSEIASMKSIHAIWHLCEVIYLHENVTQKEGRSHFAQPLLQHGFALETGVKSDHSLGMVQEYSLWLQVNFPVDIGTLQTAGLLDDGRENAVSPPEQRVKRRELYWPYVIRFIVRGRIEEALWLLEQLKQDLSCESNETYGGTIHGSRRMPVTPALQQVNYLERLISLLRDIPIPQQNSSWTLRLQSELRGIEKSWSGHGSTAFPFSDPCVTWTLDWIRLALYLLMGDCIRTPTTEMEHLSVNMFTQPRQISSHSYMELMNYVPLSWQEKLSRILLFTCSGKCERRELSLLIRHEHNKCCYFEEFLSNAREAQGTDLLDRILLSLVEVDLFRALCYCSQIDWWLIAHLSDLMHAAGEMDEWDTMFREFHASKLPTDKPSRIPSLGSVVPKRTTSSYPRSHVPHSTRLQPSHSSFGTFPVADTKEIPTSSSTPPFFPLESRYNFENQEYSEEDNALLACNQYDDRTGQSSSPELRLAIDSDPLISYSIPVVCSGPLECEWYEFYLLEYAQMLLDQPALWRIAMDYFAACPIYGPGMLQIFIERGIMAFHPSMEKGTSLSVPVTRYVPTVSTRSEKMMDFLQSLLAHFTSQPDQLNVRLESAVVLSLQSLYILRAQYAYRQYALTYAYTDNSARMDDMCPVAIEDPFIYARILMNVWKSGHVRYLQYWTDRWLSDAVRFCVERVDIEQIGRKDAHYVDPKWLTLWLPALDTWIEFIEQEVPVPLELQETYFTRQLPQGMDPMSTERSTIPTWTMIHMYRQCPRLRVLHHLRDYLHAKAHKDAQQIRTLLTAFLISASPQSIQPLYLANDTFMQAKTLVVPRYMIPWIAHEFVACILQDFTSRIWTTQDVTVCLECWNEWDQYLRQWLRLGSSVSFEHVHPLPMQMSGREDRLPDEIYIRRIVQSYNLDTISRLRCILTNQWAQRLLVGK